MKTMASALVIMFALSLATSVPTEARTAPSKTTVTPWSSTTVTPWRHGCQYTVEASLEDLGTHGEEGIGFSDTATFECRRHTRFWRVELTLLVYRKNAPDKVIARASVGPLFKKYKWLNSGAGCTPYWEEHGARFYARAVFQRRGHRKIVVKTVPIKRACAMPDNDFVWPPLEYRKATEMAAPLRAPISSVSAR